MLALVLKYKVLYNFMLNDAPNNNDVMRVANIVLNEVHLTTMGAQQFSMAAV